MVSFAPIPLSTARFGTLDVLPLPERAINILRGLSRIKEEARLRSLAARLAQLGEVAEPFAFDIGFLGSGETIIVPTGFRTDFASIPWFARWLFPTNGKVAKPALLHDYMLILIDPRAADAFEEALAVAGVGQPRRWIMATTVRLWSLL
jgi:hypothetical protein